MKRLLFIALLLSFVGSSFAIDDTAEERAATGSKRPKTPGNAPRKIALLFAERGNASILGDGYFLGNFSYSQANFANALFATTPPAASSGKPGLTPQGRIALKLLGGTVAGIGTAAIIFIGTFYTSDWCSEDWCVEDRYEDHWADRLEEGLMVSLIPIGIAVGVSAFDQHDRPIYPLAASLLGFGIGAALDVASAKTGGPVLGAILWLPVIAATVASEWSREQPESRRYSIGLKPELGGGLSMVAALRFQ